MLTSIDGKALRSIDKDVLMSIDIRDDVLMSIDIQDRRVRAFFSLV